MTPDDKHDLAAWYLDALTRRRDAHIRMRRNDGGGKYFESKEPLTPVLVALAFDGATIRQNTGHRVRLSLGARLQWDGLAQVAAIDIDTGGIAAARRALATAAEFGLWGFVQLSASARHDGGHLWLPSSAPAPAEQLLDIAHRVQAAAKLEGEAYPTEKHLRLPAMAHLHAPGGPTVYPVLLPSGELVEGDSWAIVARLREVWQANTEAKLWEADRRLPRLSVELPAIRHKSEVNPANAESVIRWYLAQVSIEEALGDIGVKIDGRARTYLCPFHDDTNPSMGILPHRNGHRVARCFAPHCRAHRPLSAFDIFCDVHNLDSSKPEDRKRAVFLIADAHGLGRRRKTTYTPTAPAPAPAAPAPRPYTLETHLELLQAQREALGVTLSDAIEERGRVTIIRGAPGIGKTRAAAETVLAAHAAGLRVAVVTPSHEHARREWLARVPDAYVWKPRKLLCTCYTPAQLEAWGNKGYAAPACTSPGCAYRQQAEEARGRVVIYQYPHLVHRDGELLKHADLIIVDEDPGAALLQEQAATLGELKALATRDERVAPLALALVAVANANYHRETYGPDLVDALRRRVPDLEQALATARTSPLARPHPPAPVGEEHPAEQLPPVVLPGLLDALEHDLAHPDGNALLTWGRTSDGWRYVWHRRAVLLRCMVGRLDAPAVVVLDGSADHELAQRLYAPWPVGLVHVGAPASPVVKIIQAPGVASTRRIAQEPERGLGVARHVAAIANELGLQFEGGISYKKIAGAMAEALGGDWSLHYGGQRGRNGLENAGVVAVVASPTVPPDAIARRARALYANEPPIDPAAERLGPGTWKHADERLERVARAAGPEELRQSIHRARVVCRTAPTTVVVCSPWDLPALGFRVAGVIEQLPYGNSKAAAEALETYRARRDNNRVTIPAILESAIREEAYSPPDSKPPGIVTRPYPAPPYEPPALELPPPPVVRTTWREVQHNGRTIYTDGRGNWRDWHPVRGWEELPPPALAPPIAAA